MRGLYNLVAGLVATAVCGWLRIDEVLPQGVYEEEGSWHNRPRGPENKETKWQDEPMRLLLQAWPLDRELTCQGMNRVERAMVYITALQLRLSQMSREEKIQFYAYVGKTKEK